MPLTTLVAETQCQWSMGAVNVGAPVRCGSCIVLGKPGDEGMMTAFHSASVSAEGKLRCVGGTYHQTNMRTITQVQYHALPLAELLALIGPVPLVRSNTLLHVVANVCIVPCR